MSETHLVGIVGSLRSGSVNAAAARAALQVLGDDVSMALHSVRDLPLFDGDAEADPPSAVHELRAAVRGADGIVLFSPEYNSSLPAVTKNVIDWLSRDASTWEGRGITMVTMSPGGRGGLGVRTHFESIMDRQAPRLFPTVGFGNYTERIGDDGELVDPATRDELARFLAEFASFCSAPTRTDA